MQVSDKVGGGERLRLYVLGGDPCLQEANQHCELRIGDLIAGTHSPIDHLIQFLTSCGPSVLILAIAFDKVGHAKDRLFDILVGWLTEVSDFS